MKIDGESVEFQSVHDAAKFGIGTVFQEFSLVPTLRIFENVYLGREPKRGLLVDRRAMADGARALFQELGFEIDIRRRVSELSRAEQQMVEIAKAFLAKARVLILDEPTASLTEKETRRLFAFIAKAKAEGVGVIYISHRIQEFAEIADKISVLRDGRMIGTVSAKNTSEQALVELMTGRSIDKIYPEIARGQDGKVVLSLQNIVCAGVHGVSIDVRAGEVLGIAGLVGSGKSRVWRSVLGLLPIKAGRVTLKGGDVTAPPDPRPLARRRVLPAPTARRKACSLLPRHARTSPCRCSTAATSPTASASSRRAEAATLPTGSRRGSTSRNPISAARFPGSRAATSRRRCSAKASRWSATSTSSTSRRSASTWVRARPSIC